MTLHTIYSGLLNALVISENKGLFNIHQRYKLYKKGEEKFVKEFDAVEFARTQRKLKMLMHSLMDESERFLAPYQKSNTIKLMDDSETDHSDDPSYVKIPKMRSNTNDKEQHRLIVENFFKNYLKEIHTEKDVHLLHGVISNKELTNEEQAAQLINNELNNQGFKNKLTRDDDEDKDIDNKILLKSPNMLLPIKEISNIELSEEIKENQIEIQMNYSTQYHKVSPHTHLSRSYPSIHRVQQSISEKSDNLIRESKYENSKDIEN